MKVPPLRTGFSQPQKLKKVRLASGADAVSPPTPISVTLV